MAPVPELDRRRSSALTITHSSGVSGVRHDFGHIDGQRLLLAIDEEGDFCG